MSVFGIEFTTEAGEHMCATALQLDDSRAVSYCPEPVVSARVVEAPGSALQLQLERWDPATRLVLVRRACPSAPRIQFTEPVKVGDQGAFVFSREPIQQGAARRRATVVAVERWTCGSVLAVDTNCDFETAGGGPLVFGDQVAGLAFAHDLTGSPSYFYDAACVCAFLEGPRSSLLNAS